MNYEEKELTEDAISLLLDIKQYLADQAAKNAGFHERKFTFTATEGRLYNRIDFTDKKLNKLTRTGKNDNK